MIFCLVKFFNEENYANEFMKGRLHAETLSYYKKIEDKSRQDDSEGSTLRSEGATVRIASRDSNIRLDNATIKLSNSRIQSFRIFCMTAGYITQKELNENPTKSGLPNFIIENHGDCLKFGKYAVMIKNVPEFIERIERVVNAQKCRWAHAFVKYEDIRDDVELRDEEAPFRKRIEFASEKEYRFVFEEFPKNTIDIGNISDITSPIETDRINDTISNMN